MATSDSNILDLASRLREQAKTGASHELWSASIATLMPLARLYTAGADALRSQDIEPTPEKLAEMFAYMLVDAGLETLGGLGADDTASWSKYLTSVMLSAARRQ